MTVAKLYLLHYHAPDTLEHFTNNDIAYICLLHAGIAPKDLMIMLHSSQNALRMRCSRLHKKMEDNGWPKKAINQWLPNKCYLS